MDTGSECGAFFAEKEIRRFLDEKIYEGLDKIRTETVIREVTPSFLQS